MLDQLDGKLIKTFIAVLEERSFSRAAEKLGYVQSTITSQIQQLEQVSGKKLFHRLPRGVEATEAGIEMSTYAYQFLRLGESLEEAMSKAEQPGGILHLFALESFCVSRMSGFLSRFLKQNPAVQLRLTTGFLADAVEHVTRHRMDLAIVAQDPKHDELIFTPLIEERLVFIASCEMSEQVAEQGFEVLEATQVIHFSQRCMYYVRAQEVLRSIGLKPMEHMEFPSVELVKQTVKLGMGIALIPEVNVRAELAEGSLHLLPFPGEIKLTHGIIQHKERELRRAARLFKDEVKEWFLKIPLV
ncbi:MAG: yofA [Paenibacillus sp.]|nr:yofA [Paenibacillus sp.]